MNIRRSFLALTAMILSVGFFSAPAMAAGCSAGPINVAGDYIADHTGDCVINGITAGGRVSVKATGSITINGPTTAGGDVSFEAQGGNAQVGAVTSGNSGSISIFSSAAITALDLDSAGSLALFSSGNITVTGMAKAVWNVASEGGGNINISGAVTSGASYLAAISTTGAGNTLTLGSTVTAGALDLIAPGNIHVIGAINSISVGSHVDIKNTAAGGTIKLDGTITAPGQKVQIVSFGNISTKTIDTTSTTSGVGDVRIIAHKNATGAIPAFVIGGSANSNGVNGSIIANTQTAGGQSPYTTNHNVGIVNCYARRIFARSEPSIFAHIDLTFGKHCDRLEISIAV
jgi:hypothetical protein